MIGLLEVDCEWAQHRASNAIFSRAALRVHLSPHPPQRITDDITGSVDLFATLGIAADQSVGYSTNLFLSATPLVFSAPIPEPASVALMVAGLSALGFMARRRRVVSAAPRLSLAGTA